METLQELAGDKLFFHLKRIERELAETLFYLHYNYKEMNVADIWQEDIDNLYLAINNLKYLKEPLEFMFYDIQFHTTAHILDFLEEGETNVRTMFENCTQCDECREMFRIYLNLERRGC